MWKSLPETQAGLFKKSVSLSKRKKKKNKWGEGEEAILDYEAKTKQPNAI